MSRSRRDYNPRNSDPAILREYRDMRNSRWSNDKLWVALPILMGYGLLVVVGALAGLSATVVAIMAAVGIIAFVAFFLLQAAWLPHGERRIAGITFVIFVVALCVLAATYGEDVVMWFLRL